MSFALPGASAETLVIALDLAGIAVSAGAACSSGKVGASHVLAAMGSPALRSRRHPRSLGLLDGGATCELSRRLEPYRGRRRERAVA